MTSWTQAQIEHVADILNAAAHADGEAHLHEGRALREVVTELAGGTLSDALAARIQGFDPAKFDFKAAGAALELSTSEARKSLLGLVARVTESDDVHDLDESDFIVKVAQAIGADASEYEGLTVSLVEAKAEPKVSKPPPVPTK